MSRVLCALYLLSVCNEFTSDRLLTGFAQLLKTGFEHIARAGH